MPHREYLLALGSSLGHQLNQLQAACQQLSEHSKLRLLQRAKIYHTPPEGAAEQGFANSAVIISTALEPVELLQEVKKMEVNLGRKPRGRWQDREIDIDLLMAKDAGVFYHPDPELWLPHKLMFKRGFVLAPAKDIAADWQHPYHRITIAEAWQTLLAQQPACANYPTSPWPKPLMLG